MSKGSKNVSVRLPLSTYEQLLAHAQDRKTNLSDLLREVIMSSTATGSAAAQDDEVLRELSKLRSLVEDSQEQLRFLTQNHAAATTALLVDAGKAEVAQAESWVRENLMGLGEEESP